MRTRYLLFPLALVHLVLALLYASQTPYRQAGYVNGSPNRLFENGQLVKDYGAPDERQHANYVQRLLDGQGLPIFNPKDPDLYENYQGHQPPLFYLLGEGWCKLTVTNNLTVPEGVRARYLNALIGGTTVVGVYFLGLWGLGRKDVGLIGAAFVAMLPMNAALSGAISNDPVLFCLCTWCLAFLSKQVQGGWTVRDAVIVGALAGLAVLTKTTGVSVFPMIVLAAFLRGPSGDKPKLALPALAVAIALLMAAPWWARNQVNYGDPLAIHAFNEAFVGSPKTSDLVNQMGATYFWQNMFGYWTIRSFFGVFGYMDVFLNETGTAYMGPQDPNGLYLILFLGTVLTILAGLRWTGEKEAKGERSGHIFNGVFAGLIFLLYLRFNLQYFQAQSRYLFPAIAPIGIAVGVGICAMVRKRWELGLLVLGMILLAVNVVALQRLPKEFALRGTDRAAKMQYVSEPH